MEFNKIWNQHKGHLQNFIKTKVSNDDIAKDILQEVGIKLFDNINRKTEIANYKSWLFQVSRNTIFDYYRELEKQSRLSKIDPETNTESAACVCDLSGFVIQHYLPEKYSKPLYLSDIEKKSQQEIAEQLNVSLSATKSRILRARIQLKELISGCIDISHNNKGEIIDFQVKNNCELPQELKTEMERINLIL